MTAFIRFRLPLFFLLLSLVGINSGCDLGTYAQRAADSAQNYTPPKVVQPAEAPEQKMEKKDQPQGPDISGNWGLDNEETVRAIKLGVHHVVLGGPAGKNKVVRIFKEARLNFSIKADGTFTVDEVMDGVEKKYRGKWTVNGSKVSLDQTHEGNSPKKDKLSGSVFGDTMNLVHAQGPIEFPIILVKK